MNLVQIGVIGNGFVGNAIYQNFKDKVKVLSPQIDYGSVFAPLAGVKSRKYHKSKDYKLPKGGK